MVRGGNMPRVSKTEQDQLAADVNTNMYITSSFNYDVGTKDVLVKSA